MLRRAVDVCVMGCDLYASLSMGCDCVASMRCERKFEAVPLRSHRASRYVLRALSRQFAIRDCALIERVEGSCAELSSLQASPATHVKRGRTSPRSHARPNDLPQAPISSAHHASRASLRVGYSIPRVDGIGGDFSVVDGRSAPSTSSRGRASEKVKILCFESALGNGA